MATGAIRYNYEKEAWEFSNDRLNFTEFSAKEHTHYSREIRDATEQATANLIVRRGPIGEAAFGRVTVGGTARLEGLFLRVGSANSVQDSTLQNIAGFTVSGTTSNFKIVIQDGDGQANLLWNATRAYGGTYLVSGEAATRVLIDGDDTGSRFGIFGSTKGIYNQTIKWQRRMLIDADGTVTFGVGDKSEDINVTIASEGNMSVHHGRVYAHAFETYSAREYKEDIQPFHESALAILNAIPIYSFKYRDDTAKSENIGIIADDILDSRISGDEYNRFNIANTVGLLVKAVQELSSRIDELERK